MLQTQPIIAKKIWTLLAATFDGTKYLKTGHLDPLRQIGLKISPIWGNICAAVQKRKHLSEETLTAYCRPVLARFKAVLVYTKRMRSFILRVLVP